jgi:prepilin-type N-terminal cleavage/methylation domain-containing protein
MRKINFFKKGFTLIELLVVVAIIGVLAALVLTSLNSGSAKGADGAVKSNLVNVRSFAELFFTSNSNSYLPSGGVAFSPVATCPVYVGAGGTNVFTRDANVAAAIAEAVKRGGNGSACYNSSGAWAVAVGLKTSGSTSWCVDSTGASRRVNLAPASAMSASGVCN